MHVITQSCCNDAACVPVCPVNCIHPTPEESEYRTSEMLYIDPDACIDCGACVDKCPVNAIVADYNLKPEHEPFVKINAQWYRDKAHQGYPVKYAAVAKPPRQSQREPLRVAVVGSGPAGCYAVEHLLTRGGSDVRVDLFERLPVPGGLVRYGVAPDHLHTKEISASFERILGRRGVSVFFNVEVGVDISHEDLHRHYHAVIYAVGAPKDRGLGVPGEDLPGSYSAREFVAWYNGHPDFAAHQFDLSAERAVIVGNGNVALDVARILTADIDVLARTDIATHALEQLAESRVREVVLLGRRGPAQAAFTVAELVGLTQEAGVDVVVRAGEVELDAVSAASFETRDHAIDLLKLRLLQQLSGTPRRSDRSVELRFRLSPTQVIGEGRVTGLRAVRNDLVAKGGQVLARPTTDEESIDCGLVFRSIGYRGRPLPGLPFDPARCVIPNDDGRVVDLDLERPVPQLGVYVTGWIKRGPSGVIGTNKQCAEQTVSALLEDFDNGLLTTPKGHADSVRDLLGSVSVIGHEEWQAIESHELQLGRAESRPRVKLVSVAEMLAVGLPRTHAGR